MIGRSLTYMTINYNGEFIRSSIASSIESCFKHSVSFLSCWCSMVSFTLYNWTWSNTNLYLCYSPFTFYIMHGKLKVYCALLCSYVWFAATFNGRLVHWLLVRMWWSDSLNLLNTSYVCRVTVERYKLWDLFRIWLGHNNAAAARLKIINNVFFFSLWIVDTFSQCIVL